MLIGSYPFRYRSRRDRRFSAATGQFSSNGLIDSRTRCSPARLGAPDRGKYREAAGAIVGKSRFLQVVKASLTLRVAKARLMLQAAKPSLTLGAAKLQAAKLRSSRHRRPQRPRRNRAALRSVRDNNTSIRPHPTTSRHDRPASHDASDHPSTRVGHDRRGQRMFVCAVGAPPARVWFAPLARVWFPPLGFSPRSLLGQRRKMTVQLASTPVQRLSNRSVKAVAPRIRAPVITFSIFALCCFPDVESESSNVHPRCLRHKRHLA
jgi:hypothetical protein